MILFWLCSFYTAVHLPTAQDAVSSADSRLADLVSGYVLRSAFCHSPSTKVTHPHPASYPQISIQEVTLGRKVTSEFQYGELAPIVSLEVAVRWGSEWPVRLSLRPAKRLLLANITSKSRGADCLTGSGFIGVSKDSRYCVGYEVLSEDEHCSYRTQYYLLDVAQGRTLSKKVLCNAFPPDGFSGVVEAGDILCYFLPRYASLEAMPLVSLTTTGEWAYLPALSPHMIKASEDGTKVALVDAPELSDFGAPQAWFFALQVRTSDLKKTLWKHRVNLANRGAVLAAVLWSTDGLLVTVVTQGGYGRNAHIYTFDAETGTAGPVIELPFAKLPRPILLMPVREPFDARAVFGVVVDSKHKKSETP